jgi:phosphatidylinositol alpha-1,6-mannosyltransferase
VSALRTLFVTPDFKPDRGGIAELYLNLLLRFPRGSVEVSTVAPPAWARAAGWRDDFPFPVRREAFGVREARRLQTVAAWARSARRRVRAGGHGLVQVGTLRPATPVAAWVRRTEGVPFVVYVHGKDVLHETAKVERSRLYRAAARPALAAASAWIANSRFTAGLVGDLAAALGVPAMAERVRVVHPGADPERFRPGGRRAGAPVVPGGDGVRGRGSAASPETAPGVDDGGEAGVRADVGSTGSWGARAADRRADELCRALDLHGKGVALTVARLMPRKGVDRTLEAVAALAPEFPDLVYVVAGDGPQRAELERRAAAPDLAGRVRFTGEVEDADVPALHRLADVFLLPSRREAGDEVEGFGMALVEAGASGLPVIGGRSGGIPEAVVEGETGLLVDGGDPRAIAGALRRLLEDAELARRLGAGGRREVERRLNWERAAAEAWGIVQEVAATTFRAAARPKADPQG